MRILNFMKYLQTDRSGIDEYHGHKYNRYGIKCSWNPEGCMIPSEYENRGKCGDCNRMMRAQKHE
jgi:hypothetical protein